MTSSKIETLTNTNMLATVCVRHVNLDTIHQV